MLSKIMLIAKDFEKMCLWILRIFLLLVIIWVHEIWGWKGLFRDGERKKIGGPRNDAKCEGYNQVQYKATVTPSP